MSSDPDYRHAPPEADDGRHPAAEPGQPALLHPAAADRRAEGYPQSREPAATEPEVLSLQGLFAILMRGKFTLAGICLVGLGLTYMLVGDQAPLYRAEAQLVIGESRQNVTNLDSVIEDRPVDYFTAKTEAAIVNSRAIAREAVERLDLADNPDFNPALRPDKPSVLDGIWKAVGGWLSAIGLGGDEKNSPEPQAPMTDAERDRALRDYLANRYLRAQTVETTEASRVITIEFVARDPRLAARAANMTADLYLERQRDEKGQIASSAGNFLTQQVEKAQQRLLESEKELEALSNSLGIQANTGSPAEEEQLSRLNADLSEARRKLADARASYQQVQELALDGSQISTASEVLNSPLIRELRVQEVKLVRRIAEYQAQFREGHPQMVKARAELRDLRNRIESEVDKIATQLGNEYELAQQRVATLQSEIADLRNEVRTMNDAEAELRALQSEVRVNRQLYDALLQRLQETDIENASLQEADAQLISRAVPPDHPFAPRLGLSLAVAFVLSFGLGSAVLLVKEMFDRGFRSLGQVQEMLGVTGIGMVPLIKVSKGESPHPRALEDHSAFAEAIRTIRTALLLAGEKSSPLRTVMTVSAQPGEGKTSTSLSLAVQSNHSGRPTIVVDCDMRRAMLDSYIGTKHDTGLADYLAGQAELGAIIHIDDATGTPFIPAGTRPANPSDLLASPRMDQMLTRLKTQFDLVILDTPPLLAVSDSLAMARKVDGALLMISWARTRRDVVASALQMMQRTGGNVIGAVLTNVDTRRHAQYDYADSGYYYSRVYRGYYSKAA